jgi:hypothetical protein
MPVLQRALKQRDTETKMFAAQIIGNMSSLTNQKDLEPYLPQILPGLKQVNDVNVSTPRVLATRARRDGRSEGAP